MKKALKRHRYSPDEFEILLKKRFNDYDPKTFSPQLKDDFLFFYCSGWIEGLEWAERVKKIALKIGRPCRNRTGVKPL
jgi:hypothetical protein